MPLYYYDNNVLCYNNDYYFFFLAHINHIKNVAGEDHVGLGAGYDGINQ